MATYGKESLVVLTLLLGALLAVLGGQFMSGVSQGASAGAGTHTAAATPGGALQATLVEPKDDRWG